MNKTLYSTGFKLAGDCLVESFHHPTLTHTRLSSIKPKRILERLDLREILDDQIYNLPHVLLQNVDDRVRPGIERIRCLELATAARDRDAVVLDDERDDRPAHVVQVKDRGFGIERDGVELVRVAHRHARKGVKVARADRLRDGAHALGDDRGDAVREERRGLDGALHPRGGRRGLLVVGHDADEGVQLGPVRARCDLDREGVAAVRGGAHLPGDEPAKEGAAGGAGALACDEGEGGGGCGEGVERR